MPENEGPATEPEEEAMTTATTTDDNVCDEVVRAIKSHKRSFKAQGAEEPDERYLGRMLEAVADLPDANYKRMPEAAHQWFEQGAEVANAGGTPEAPSGFVSAFKPKTRTTIARSAPAENKRTPPGPTRREGPTIGKLIRQAVIRDRNVKIADLETLLTQNGFTDLNRKTVSSFQRGTLDTLLVAEEMGRFSWD